MKVYTCPLCGDATDANGDLFTAVDAVVAHIDDSQDDRHDGERGADHGADIEEHGIDVSEPDADESTATVSFDGTEPTIVYEDGERPLGEVLEELDDHVADVDMKFKRVVQEQQHAIKRIEETIEAHKLAIQELQAGMEALAEEHDRDVEYQFTL